MDEPWERGGPGDPRLNLLRELRKLRNYFDLLRAAVGGLAIMGGHGIAASLVPSAPGSRAQMTLFAVQLAILTVGLAIQAVRQERGHLSFFAPVFYLIGLSVALCGGWAALFAFVLIWAVNPMLGNAQAFLTVLGLVMLGFGMLFRHTSPQFAGTALILCWMPVLLSLLTQRPLVVFTRRPPPDPNAS